MTLKLVTLKRGLVTLKRRRALALVDHGRQEPKYRRRSKDEINSIKSTIRQVLFEYNPQTLRQLFYQLVVKSVIEKLEKEYKNVVIRLLTNMRMADDVPFKWIIDESKHRETYRTYNSLKDALKDTAKFYRRNALTECPDYLEIFVDKQALVGFVHEAAGEYDVPVIPGGTGLSQLWETACCIRDAWKVGKRSFVYQFGDYDATGLIFAKAIERRLIQLCEKLGCPSPTFERVALTKEQIDRHNLPSRPSKTFKQGNMHAKDFEGESTELDALPADILKDMVTECIERHIRPEELEVIREAEASERKILKSWMGMSEDDDDEEEEAAE